MWPQCQGGRMYQQMCVQRSHSQLFCHTSKSCVVNFAFFASNPFNLPRVVGWYHWNPQNHPKGALFRRYKKSRIFFKKSVKIINWPWMAHFWAHRHLSYHFGRSNGTNQLPWVGWRGSMQKTQNSQRMIWKGGRIAENGSHVLFCDISSWMQYFN